MRHARKNTRFSFNGKCASITANLAERRLMDRLSLARDVERFVSAGRTIEVLPHYVAEPRRYVGWAGRLV